MEPLELRHDRYRLTPTAEIWSHEHASTFHNIPTATVHNRVLHYNNEVQNGNFDPRILDALLTTLCYEYQVRIQSKVRCIPENFDNSIFKSIIEILLNNAEVLTLDERTVNLLLDIIVLEMVLYSINDEIKSIASTVQVSRNGIASKIISNLIDALYLNAYIHERNGSNQSGLIQIVEPLKTMFDPAPDANDEYFDLLSATIQKLMATFSTNDVLYFLWSLILTDEHNNKKNNQFKLLTIALDIILPVNNKINLRHICKDEFWHLICYGLKSDVNELQNSVHYLMTIALNYVEKERVTLENNSLIPFVGCQRDDGHTSVQEMKAQFFSILECLEETEAHLVLPALSHLNKLVKSSLLHKACGNCFDQLYLHCLFKRILNHQTNSVMNTGLNHLLRMHPAMYDDEFLTMLIESLKNPLLYSSTSTNQLPKIVQSLGEMLYNSDGYEIDLINRFIRMAATHEWSAIPFFYVIQALAMAASQTDAFKTNIWTLTEYQAVVKMIETNIKSFTRPLQDVIANNMSKILPRCAGEIHLNVIARILFALGHSFDYNSSDNAKLSKDVHGFCHLNYSNNPKIWGALIDCVKEKVNDQDVIDYVCHCCTELCVDATAKEFDVEYFAVMICLLAKAGKDFSSLSPYGEPLGRCFVVVRDMHARPRANTTVLVKIVELFTCLKRHAFEDDVDAFTIACPSLIPVIWSCKESFWQIVMSSLEPSRIPTAYSEARLYIACLEAILTKGTKVGDNCPQDLLQFYKEAWKIVGEFTGHVDVRFLYALHVVGVCHTCKCFFEYTNQQLDSFWRTFMSRQALILTVSENHSGESEKMIYCECYGIISQLIEMYIRREFFLLNNFITPILLRLHKMVEIGKEYVILQAIKIVFQLGIADNNGSFICSKDLEFAVINLAWTVLWHCKKSNLFWTCLKRLINRMLNSISYGFPLSPNLALDNLEAWLTSAENPQHAKMILVSEIRHSLAKFSWSAHPAEFLRLLHIPLTCYLDINEATIEANLYNLHREILKGHPCREEYLDLYYRACCVSTIQCAMKNHSIADSIAATLISQLKGFAGIRYSANSKVHRQKHRVMQLLLLSYPYWSEATVKSVHDDICHFIVHETDQPTVRVMQQWLLAWIYIKYRAMHEKIWELLEKGKKKRPDSIPPITTIICQVSTHLPSEEKLSFADTAIRKLLPCSLSREFIIDLFLQVAVSNFFGKPEYTLIETLRQSKQLDNVEKNLAQLAENFLFTSFDPIENFDIQTIFYDLPRLLRIHMDECIDPSDLKDLSFIGKVLNPTSKLNSISIPHQLLEIRERSHAPDAPNSSRTPVVNLAFDEEVTSRTQQSRTDGAGLIVVASLVDDIVNLGGIAKSADIFCAKRLILGYLACTQHRQFQALSSERKITLTEVKPNKLRDYLVRKKSLGWSVVGVEQTIGSFNVLDTKFNRKTVLLLGNEQNGIPENLISLLDICVKIPQTEVVGSLNVHVAGAICMWHYAREYNF